MDRALDDLDAGATRIERLVDDLLLLARTDAEAVDLVATDTDLAQVAAEATEAFEAVAGQGGVRLVLDVVPAPIHGDEGRLRQLVGILLDNAIRHSPAGGRVLVAVRQGRLVVEDEGDRHRTRGRGAGLRSLLACARRACWGNRARPGDRPLDRGAPSRVDPSGGAGRRRARGAVRGRPARRLSHARRDTLAAWWHRSGMSPG